ncbi:MAG: CbiX/SirB N-terminal domain-containing protein [Paracoccaceae bacterium]
MRKSALIVAHGQPSDPAPAEADLAALTDLVARHLPGWQIGSATLAAEGRLEDALARLDQPLILPFFMADGWFTKVNLPKRLTAAGLAAPRILPPFGLMDALPALLREALDQALMTRDWRVEDTALLLAAHGSGRSRAPAAAANRLAAAIGSSRPFADLRLGFIEETPRLAEAARGMGPKSLCLPLFVARWGHVETDIPAALTEAGFGGDCLDPIGLWPTVPALLAEALRRA